MHTVPYGAFCAKGGIFFYMQYIMSLDQGTTSSRCILFDKQGNIISMAQKEYQQIYPKAGWVEHDPMEIWQTQLEVAQQAIAQKGLTAADIAAIGITNQRETTILWDKRTGKPIYNAIVWQCRRTAKDCDTLAQYRDMFQQKTGLLLDAYFSATKIRWILHHVPNAKKLAEQGNLLFGTVDTWLIWHLTGGQCTHYRLFQCLWHVCYSISIHCNGTMKY